MGREEIRGNKQLQIESPMIYPASNTDSIMDVILAHLAFAHVSIVKQCLAIVNTSKECSITEIGNLNFKRICSIVLRNEQTHLVSQNISNIDERASVDMARSKKFQYPQSRRRSENPMLTKRFPHIA